MSPPSSSDAKAPRVPMDRVARQILSHLSRHPDFDATRIAQTIGAKEEVVRQRLGAMVQGGVLRGVHLDLNPDAIGMAYEFLLMGMPTSNTDRGAIDRLCGATGVTRVFGVASSHSVVFTVRGTDAAETQVRGLQLANEAGLAQARAIMIVNTFRDRPGPGWEGDSTPDAPSPVA
ncbi:MAG: Lrp/AsnC family transcriptional regulator [Thermoplasmatota archaeon]